jgi:hypothetical protein
MGRCVMGIIRAMLFYKRLENWQVLVSHERYLNHRRTGCAGLQVAH